MDRLAVKSVCALVLMLLSVASSAQQPQRQPELMAQLTEPQREFIREHPLIRIGVNRSLPPISFVNQQGQYSGYTEDILIEISKLTGLRFEMLPLPDWADVISAAEKHQVDVLPAVVQSASREAYLSFTSPYLDTFQVIITRQDEPSIESLADFAGRRVALIRGSNSIEMLKQKYPQLQPVLVAGIGEALQAVASKRADATPMSLVIANYHISLLGLTNLKVAAPLGEIGQKLRMGVRNDWPALREILDQAILSIDPAKRRMFRDRWLAQGGLNYDEAKAWRPTTTEIYAAIVLLVLSVLGWLWAVLLRRAGRKWKMAQAKAEVAETRLRDIVAAMPAVVWQLRAELGRAPVFTYASETMAVLVSTEASAISRIPAAEYQQFLHLVETHSRSLTPFEFEHHIVTAQGETRRVLANAVPRRDGAGVLWHGCTVDISGLHRLKQDLDAARTRLEDLAAGVPGALWQFKRDPDGQQYYSYMSEGIRGITGRTPEETNQLMLNQAFSVVHPDDMATLAALMQRLTETSAVEEARYRLITAAGDWKWVQISASSRLEPDGSQVWNGITLDATRAHQVEEELEAARQRLKEVIDSVPGVVWRMRRTPDGRYVFSYLSDGAFEITGRTAAYMIDHADEFFADLAPTDRTRVLAELERTAGTNEDMQIEFTRRHADGRPLVLLARCNAGHTFDGQPQWTGVLIDVTARRQLELELADARRRIEDITNGFPGAIWQMQCPPGGPLHYTYVSDNMRTITGREPRAPNNRAEFSDEYIHPDDRQRVAESVTRGLHEVGSLEIDYRLITASGDLRWVHSAATSRVLDDGTIVWNGILLDASNQKRLESELREARESAEAGSRAKGRFLANMSHEIRTPMNAVIGLSHLALDAEREPAQRERLSKINRAAKALLRLLNDILEFSKIEAKKLTLVAASFSLAELLETLQLLVGTSASEKGLAFHTVLSADLPPFLWGDSLRLQQVLLNLLANAIKFTDAGEVELSVRRRVPGVANDSQIGVLFEVRDTGVGLSESQLARVFDAFEQADDASSRRHGGTGLGLSISQELVHLMGGNLLARSTFGEGSVFSVSLDFTLPPTVNATPGVLIPQSFEMAIGRLVGHIIRRETTARAAALQLRRQLAAQGRAQELDNLERLLAAYDFEGAEIELSKLRAVWGVLSTTAK